MKLKHSDGEQLKQQCMGCCHQFSHQLEQIDKLVAKPEVWAQMSTEDAVNVKAIVNMLRKLRAAVRDDMPAVEIK